MAAISRLVLNSGPTPGKEFPLEKAELFIGRDIGNDIVINDPEVSRRHARLYMQGNMYIIEDLGSTNGTTVNGQKLTGPYMLRSGEQVTFGEHVNLAFLTTAIAPEPPAFMQQPAAQQQAQAKQAPVPQSQQPVYQPAAQQPQNYPAQQQYPYQAPYQQPVYPPQQQAYTPPPVGRSIQSPYPSVEPQGLNSIDQSQYSGQVPTPAYIDEPIIQYRIPIWMFVVIGVLLITILVLLVDDFHLWCPVFGLC